MILLFHFFGATDGCKRCNTAYCDMFTGHLCHVLLCHLCICVHFRRALESQAKRHICHHIGLHRFCTLRTAPRRTSPNTTVDCMTRCESFRLRVEQAENTSYSALRFPDMLQRREKESQANETKTKWTPLKNENPSVLGDRIEVHRQKAQIETAHMISADMGTPIGTESEVVRRNKRERAEKGPIEGETRSRKRQM